MERPDLARGDRIVRVLDGLADATGVVQALKPTKTEWFVEWRADSDGMTYSTSATAIYAEPDQFKGNRGDLAEDERAQSVARAFEQTSLVTARKETE